MAALRPDATPINGPVGTPLCWTQLHDLTSAAALLRAERDENTCRKGLTTTEEHSLYEGLLALQRPAPADSTAGSPEQHRNTTVGAAPSGPSVRARQSVAEIVTGSAGRHKTFEKIGEAKRIAENPERSEALRQKAREALAEMDRTGNISGPHTRLMLAVQAEETRNGSDTSSWSEEGRSLLKELREEQTVIVSFREHHANLVRWA